MTCFRLIVLYGAATFRLRNRERCVGVAVCDSFRHMPADADADAVWDEWTRITRFLKGARLAFDREASLWASLQISGPVLLSVSGPKGKYEVDLADHLASVEDEETLYASVLIHSYAVAEAAASDQLSISASEFGGIEDWGKRLLDSQMKDWSDLGAGLGVAVESAVFRNAFAHGSRVIDIGSVTRLKAAGITNRPAGSAIQLDFDKLQEFRQCLRHLLNLGGIRRSP